MLQAYAFNSDYRPETQVGLNLPSLRLLEGGKFHPGETAPVIVSDGTSPRIRYQHWSIRGLSFCNNEHSSSRRNTLDVNTVLKHPALRMSLLRQRCLVPVDGIYLRNKFQSTPQISRFSLPSGNTFCLAGLYISRQLSDGSLRHEFAVLTSPAKGDFAEHSLNMPLILPRGYEKLWINQRVLLEKIIGILKRPPMMPSMVKFPVQELDLSQERFLQEFAAA